MSTTTARPQLLRRPINTVIATALATMALAQTATPAAAADRDWTCTTNNFTNGNCWRNPGTVVSSDNLFIRPNGQGPVIVNFPGTAGVNLALTIQSLTVNGAPNSTAPTLNITSGSLSMSNYFDVGRGGLATVAQTGGIVGAPTVAINAAGTMNVSGVSQLIATSLVNAGALAIAGQNAQVQAVTASNSGTLTMVDAASKALNGLTNTGLIDARNSTITGLQWNAGEFRARGPTVALPHSQPLRNTGAIAINNDAEISLPAGLRNDAGGTVLLAGIDTGSGPQAYLSNRNSGAILTNFGTIRGEGFVVMPVDNKGVVESSGTGVLTFSQSFASAPGSAMSSARSGTLNFAGPTSFHNGALISGTGNTTLRDTVNVGTAAAAGRLTVEGSVVLGNIYNADILGTDAGFGYDQLMVGGQLTFAPGSILKLNSGSFVAQAGQRFNLFDWGTRQGNFLLIDAGGLRLANGATLDMSRLYVDGTVAVVPEPATWLSLGVGLLLIGARLRRRR